jgi:hypothetical protein
MLKSSQNTFLVLMPVGERCSDYVLGSLSTHEAHRIA